jgi:hypothetical protein
MGKGGEEHIKKINKNRQTDKKRKATRPSCAAVIWSE